MRAVRPRPCGSCPYRVGVPSAIWVADEYAILPRYDAPTGEQPPNPFLCHTQDGSLCAGWAGCHNARPHARDLLSLRIGIALGRIDPAALDYRSPVPLYASGEAAAAHGLRDIDNPGPDALRLITALQRQHPDPMPRAPKKTQPTAAPEPADTFDRSRRLEWDKRREEGEPSALDKLKQWLELKAEESALKEKMDALKPVIIDIVTDETNDTVIGVLGCDFKVSQRKTYTYSDYLTNQEKQLKLAKKMEEANGDAKISGGSVVIAVTKSRG